MRGRVNAIRTFKGLVADLRYLSLCVCEVWQIVIQPFLCPLAKDYRANISKILLITNNIMEILSNIFLFRMFINCQTWKTQLKKELEKCCFVRKPILQNWLRNTL